MSTSTSLLSLLRRLASPPMRDPTVGLRRAIPAGLAIVATQAFDWVSTSILVAVGGRELNPVMALVVDDPAMFAAAKIVIAAVCVYATWRRRWAAWMFSVVMLPVIALNAYGLWIVFSSAG